MWTDTVTLYKSEGLFLSRDVVIFTAAWWNFQSKEFSRESEKCTIPTGGLQILRYWHEFNRKLLVLKGISVWAVYFIDHYTIDNGPFTEVSLMWLHCMMEGLIRISCEVDQTLYWQSKVSLCQFMAKSHHIITFEKVHSLSYICSIFKNISFCGSVVEHCISSEKGHGFNSQGTHLKISNTLPTIVLCVQQGLCHPSIHSQLVPCSWSAIEYHPPNQPCR